MDEDRETFEMTFVVEQREDGQGRVVRSIETQPDGSQVVTEYEDVLPRTDPYVRSRRRTVGDDPPHEILTEFCPSSLRPPTYPAGFPFLAGRDCYTTESPAGSMSPGARWRSDDPEAVMAALVDACIGDGWTQVPPPNILPRAFQDVAAAFKRGEGVLLFHRIDYEGGSVIQMLVLDQHSLDSIGGKLSDGA